MGSVDVGASARRIRVLSARLLTTGNTAKLYCLELIDHAAAEMEGEFRVLDLGCGDGSNFRELLRRRRNVRYIGVEPLRGPAEEARRMLPGAEIINAPAYDVRVEPAHAVVSFSVLEHVVDRRRYFEAMRTNLRRDGRVYLTTTRALRRRRRSCRARESSRLARARTTWLGVAVSQAREWG